MPGTTSTALPSFSHDQHHEADAAKQKGGKERRREGKGGFALRANPVSNFDLI